MSTRGQCCLNCFCVIDPADLLQCWFVSACRHDELLRGDFRHHKLLICTHASKETFYLSSDDTRREFCPKACSGPDPWAGPHRGSELFWWLEQMSSSRRSPETSLDFIQTSLWSFSQSLVNKTHLFLNFLFTDELWCSSKHDKLYWQPCKLKSEPRLLVNCLILYIVRLSFFAHLPT